MFASTTAEAKTATRKLKDFNSLNSPILLCIYLH